MEKNQNINQSNINPVLPESPLTEENVVMDTLNNPDYQAFSEPVNYIITDRMINRKNWQLPDMERTSPLELHFEVGQNVTAIGRLNNELCAPDLCLVYQHNYNTYFTYEYLLERLPALRVVVCRATSERPVSIYRDIDPETKEVSDRMDINLPVLTEVLVSEIYPTDYSFDWARIEFEHNGETLTGYMGMEYLAHKSLYSDDVGIIPAGTERVDRWHSLPYYYEPDDLQVIPVEYRVPGKSAITLRAEALSVFIEFMEAAKESGYDIRIMSAFRSADYQMRIYRNTVYNDGAKQMSSAKPTYSEHQLGTTADVSMPEVNWRIGEEVAPHMYNTRAHQWIRENASRFHLYITYSKDSYSDQGYIWEPWHLRYMPNP